MLACGLVLNTFVSSLWVLPFPLLTVFATKCIASVWGVAGARKARQQSQQGRAGAEKEGSCCSWSFFEGVRGRSVSPAEVPCYGIRDGVCLCLRDFARCSTRLRASLASALVSRRCRGAASPPAHPTSHHPPPPQPPNLPRSTCRLRWKHRPRSARISWMASAPISRPSSSIWRGFVAFASHNFCGPSCTGCVQCAISTSFVLMMVRMSLGRCGR